MYMVGMTCIIILYILYSEPISSSQVNCIFLLALYLWWRWSVHFYCGLFWSSQGHGEKLDRMRHRRRLLQDLSWKFQRKTHSRPVIWDMPTMSVELTNDPDLQVSLSRKLSSASWSPSCFSKVLGGMESPTVRNFSVNYPPPPQAVWPWCGLNPRGHRQQHRQHRHPLHFYTSWSTLGTPHSPLYTLHCTLYTPHSTLYTWHSTLYTLHFTHYTWHTTFYTPHTTLDTPHPTPHTLLSTLHTCLHCTLDTVHCTLHTLHFTVHTPHFTLSRHTPYTSLCTLTTLHFSHFTLYETLA